MIKKHSLFFQILLFGKLFCFSDKNTFSFDDIIFLRMIPGKYILKESGIKFVGCYGNA